MLEIVKDDVKKSNFDIFLNEINYLKRNLADDDNIVTKKVTRNVKKLFFDKKETCEIVYKKGNYISLEGFCESLKEYVEYIEKKTLELENNCIKNKLLYNNSFTVCFNGSSLSISSYYFNPFTESSFKYYIVIDCSEKIPIIKEDKENIFEKIRPYLYEFLPCVYNYYDFKIETEERTFNIGEITTLKFNISDLINTKKISIDIEFENFAVISIIIEKGNIKCLTFSGDIYINKYLNDNKDTILKDIFIEESVINGLLSIINITKFLKFTEIK